MTLILHEARRLAHWHVHEISEVAVPRDDGKLEVLMVCDCDASAVIVLDDDSTPYHLTQTSDLLSRDCAHASLRNGVEL